MFSFFQIDFKKLAVLLTPTFLRQSKMIAWYKVITSGLNGLHYDFLEKCNDDLYRLSHNGQVCYLRKVLNDKFDPDKRRIVIVSGSSDTPKYIYTEGENKPVFLKKIYINPSSNYAYTGVDFIVKLPQEVWNREKTKVEIGEYRHYNVEALVDFYRVATRRYIIDVL